MRDVVAEAGEFDGVGEIESGGELAEVFFELGFLEEGGADDEEFSVGEFGAEQGGGAEENVLSFPGGDSTNQADARGIAEWGSFGRDDGSVVDDAVARGRGVRERLHRGVGIGYHAGWDDSAEIAKDEDDGGGEIVGADAVADVPDQGAADEAGGDSAEEIGFQGVGVDELDFEAADSQGEADDEYGGGEDGADAQERA